jgi:4-alpha-glucanotransferase
VTLDPSLARLAALHGVATTYEDQLKRPVQVAPDAVVGVLGALGVDATSAAAVADAVREAEARTDVPDVVVVRRSRGGRVTIGGPALLRLEDGTRRPVAADGGRITVPPGLPLGWHCLETDHGDLPVVVTPDRLTTRGGRGWGWMVQLYAMRSRTSWGVGDVADLRSLTEWTAQHGGDLVLVNPLHAVPPNAPMQPSPYYPGSRRWTNPLYLRVEDTSWYRHADVDVRAEVDALRPAYDEARIDRDAAWQAKLAALETMWHRRTWHRDYLLPSDDDDLWAFATWCALCEVHGNDWRSWPEPLRRPGAPAVEQARHDLDDRVRFFAWLQVLCHEQLAAAQEQARSAGMSIGVVHDLAVGADPGGADAWILQDALALGARIGAPPDGFNQQGQDWGMPPWHPRRLAAMRYEPLRDMLRSLLRHAGGVRIDHILGMFRLWWIPGDATARDGTYVSYDAEALLGVIALEAERAGAVVIGEDLGTVPDKVRATLDDRGVLGSSVLWFERTEVDPGETGPLAPQSQWRESAVASATTHDLPTVLGWLRGEHIRVRARAGVLDDPEADELAWQREREELLAHLVEAGALDSVDAEEDELVRAMHRYLVGTPSRYVLAAPGDAVGDLRQPNLPGTVDEYPNWRLPIADESGRPVLLEDLLADPRVERLAADLDRGVR